MKLGSRMCRLILIEFEQYWNFPAFELVLFAALFSVLNRYPSSPGNYFMSVGPMVQILVISVLIPRSFAGSFSRREMNVLLSYPVKRWEILASKTVTAFLVFFGALVFAFLLYVPLSAISLFSDEIYTVLGVVALHTAFLVSTAIFISLAIKNEAMSAFFLVLTLLGLEFTLTTSQEPYRYFALTKGGDVLWAWTWKSLHPSFPREVAFGQFSIALAYPLVTSILLIVASFIYFKWIMQLD